MLVAGAAAALAMSRGVGAQQPGRTYRVASAYIAAAPNVAELDAALLEGLRENGFELVLNLKSARALGISIPPAILLRADRLIQ